MKKQNLSFKSRTRPNAGTQVETELIIDALETKRSQSKTSTILSDEIEWWLIDGSSNIIPESFLFLCREYDPDQKPNMAIWNKLNIRELPRRDSIHKGNNVMNSKFKTLIRKGIPLQLFRSVITQIFKKTTSFNSIEYESSVEVATRSGVPKDFENVPLFSEVRDFEEIEQAKLLSDEGIRSFKKIMWVFQKNTPRLNYSPLLPITVIYLLCFMKEEEVYFITKTLLEESDQLLNIENDSTGEAISQLRWYLTFKKGQHHWCLEHFTNFCKQRSLSWKKLKNHFEKIGFNYQELFEKWLRNMFFEYLPLDIVIKIFGAYLNEGIKVYFKIAFSILRLFIDDLLAHKNAEIMEEFLRDKMQKITQEQFDKIYGYAFTRRFRAFLGQKLYQTKIEIDMTDDRSLIYHLPDMSEPSLIMNTKHLAKIWTWIPDYYKSRHLNLAYSSKKHGWSLRTIYNNLANLDYHAAFLLIKCDDNLSFGSFLDTQIKIRKGGSVFSGSCSSFVFQLEPELKRYAASGKNSYHFIGDSEYLAIGGGGEGNAIYLKDDLSRGFSHKSETYDNEQLNGGANKFDAGFTTTVVEVYIIE